MRPGRGVIGYEDVKTVVLTREVLSSCFVNPVYSGIEIVPNGRFITQRCELYNGVCQ